MLEVETVRRTGRFELDPVGPYSISASARFLEGFAPAQYEGAGPEHLRFAFVADGMDRSERERELTYTLRSGRSSLRPTVRPPPRWSEIRSSASSRWMWTAGNFRRSGGEIP